MDRSRSDIIVIEVIRLILIVPTAGAGSLRTTRQPRGAPSASQLIP